MQSLVSANESACPCCGHDEDNKIKKWKNGKYHYGNCETCNSSGIVTLKVAEKFCDEYGIDNELIPINF